MKTVLCLKSLPWLLIHHSPHMKHSTVCSMASNKWRFRYNHRQQMASNNCNKGKAFGAKSNVHVIKTAFFISVWGLFLRLRVVCTNRWHSNKMEECKSSPASQTFSYSREVSLSAMGRVATTKTFWKEMQSHIFYQYNEDFCLQYRGWPLGQIGSKTDSLCCIKLF